MNLKEEVLEARLERLKLGPAVSCVIAMLYPVATSFMG